MTKVTEMTRTIPRQKRRHLPQGQRAMFLHVAIFPATMTRRETATWSLVQWRLIAIIWPTPNPLELTARGYCRSDRSASLGANVTTRTVSLHSAALHKLASSPREEEGRQRALPTQAMSFLPFLVSLGLMLRCAAMLSIASVASHTSSRSPIERTD